MRKKNKHQIIPLGGFFWKKILSYEDRIKDFQDRTGELMEQSGALSGKGEDTHIDLDCYDHYIVNHLKQLKKAAESATSEDDVYPYYRAADDLLTERLDYLNALSETAYMVKEAINDDFYDHPDREIKRVKSAFLPAVNFSKILLDHFIHSRELVINFNLNSIRTSGKQ